MIFANIYKCLCLTDVYRYMHSVQCCCGGWFEIGSGNLYQLGRLKRKLLKIEISTEGQSREEVTSNEKIVFL